jgi:putative serine protease PepD
MPALGVVLLIAAGVAGALIATAVNTPSDATTTAASLEGGSSSCNVTSIADQELPCVVTIFAGGGTSGGVGSGEVIRSDRYILTNNHVILPAVGGGSLHVVYR